MKQEVMKLWIEALRSGEYIQGNMYLKRDNRYCCLGVLCEVMQKETGLLSIRSTNHIGDCVLYDEAAGALPLKVQAWAGMRSHDGVIPNSVNLTSMNDSFNKSFEEIADVIEEKWEVL